MDSAGNDRWEIYDESLPFAGAQYSSLHIRMVVVGLGGGDLLVMSPGAPMSEARWEQLARLGTPRFLLAPNHFHNWGITLWKARFPEARVVAHPRAHARLRRKLPGVAIEGLEPLMAALPDGVRVFGPPMARQGETWLSVRTREGVAWFVTDVIVNEPRLPGGALGLFVKLMGFRAELMTNPVFTRVFLTDKAAYKAWVTAELERDRPVLFLPSHGAPLRGPDVCSRLQAVTVAA